MSCDHDLDAEYLYPSDAQILAIDEEGGQLRFVIAVPCPDCGQALKLTAPVETVEETSLELPLDDPEDVYD